MIRPALLLVLLLLPLCLFQACRGDKPEQKPWNLLLVTFDTTRADRIGCYGNDRIETPALDKLSQQGIRFAHAMSTNPITAPSHSTILTGRYPIAHGIRDNGLFKLAEEQVTLAEILRGQGYATAAAIGAFPLSSLFGLDQGFDYYNDHLTAQYENHLGQRTIPKDRLFFDERKASQVNEAALPWLDDHAQQPFFLWIHYFDPHQPFEPEPPYNHRYADDLYNGEIAYADASLGFLLDYIENLGVLERTLVVMTSDHGEGRGDHNELTHAVLAYNSTLHVPLIIRPPAGAAPAGLVVEDRVGTVDILPTILDLLHIDPPEVNGGDDPGPSTLQGHSLVPFWRDEVSGDRPLYAENLSPALTHGWGELRVWYEDELKFIHGPRSELYDLRADPAELRNLISTRPEDAARMRHKLVAFLENNALQGVSATEVMDESVMEQLAALGYLHVSGDGHEMVAEGLREGGVHPQDRVGDVNDMSTAKHFLFEGRFAEALPFTSRLMKADAQSPAYQELHGSALAGVGRMDEAWEMLQRMRARGKVSESFLLWMTNHRFSMGETEPALDVLEKFVEGRPSAKSAWSLANFYLRLDRKEAYRGALEQALELDPAFVQARMDLAIYHAEMGNPEIAEQGFLRALSDAPLDPRVHLNYGAFLLHGGWLQESGAHLRRAIDLAPKYLKAHLALVTLHLTAGERTEAEAVVAHLQNIAPQSEETRTAVQLLARP